MGLQRVRHYLLLVSSTTFLGLFQALSPMNKTVSNFTPLMELRFQLEEIVFQQNKFVADPELNIIL